ncbi:ABC transporter permease [Sphaerisporangium perillae]|uniref:ABC transporter permease n=1 Tax=Sphaerisporangium perillae TaxID=2935860 RepID=UPI002010BD8B|nr:ABC transporter permease [Sphaerisporangium perillae]
MINARVVRGVVGVAGLLAVAELIGRSGVVDPVLLPRMSAVLAGAAELLVDPRFLSDISGTLLVWGGGLLIAVVVAAPLGILLGSLPKADLAARPLVEFLRPIPSIVLIPLVTFLLPWDHGVKMTVVVYAALWPVLINTMYGLRDVDPLAKETLRSFGFGKLAVLRRVSLPSAAPFVVTGVRVATSIALIVTISAELLAGGSDGIGAYMIRAQAGFRTDLVLAATVWTGVLGFAANALLVRAHRWAFRWHVVKAGGAT